MRNYDRCVIKFAKACQNMDRLKQFGLTSIGSSRKFGRVMNARQRRRRKHWLRMAIKYTVYSNDL